MSCHFNAFLLPDARLIRTIIRLHHASPKEGASRKRDVSTRSAALSRGQEKLVREIRPKSKGNIMRFTRLLPSFAAVGTVSVMFLAACSSDDNKSGGGANTAGSNSAGTAGHAAKAGSAGTTAISASGSAGKIGGAGTSAVAPAAGSAGSPVVTPVAGAAGTTGVTPTAGTTSVVTPVAGAPSGGAGGAGGAGGVAPVTGGTTSIPGGGKPATGGAPPAAGAGGTTAASATLHDLIGALCNWEFKCCDAGEARWELGPNITTAADCKARFIDLLDNNNSTVTPYPSSGSMVSGLLTTLGYALNPARVTENPTGIAACIAQWEKQSCMTAADPNAKPTHCSGSTYGTVANPCALGNLVSSKQKANDPCTDLASLKQSDANNDVECVAGTSCISANSEDNSTAAPMCITRGSAGSTCAADKECDFDLYCSSGKCTAKGGPGDACAYQSATAPKPNVLSAPCKPGLACNPNTLKCVKDCTDGFVCAGTADQADLLCPVGSSCLRAVVGNDADSFTICGTIGTVAGAKCNSREDCAANLYCDGTTCQARVSTVTPACSTTAKDNCVDTMFCKASSGTTGVCTVYTDVGKNCTQAGSSTVSLECDPVAAKAGCVADGVAPTSGTTINTICSSTLLASGKYCNGDQDCLSERCEFATAAATAMTCIAGAAVGAGCDGDTATATDGKTRCAPGLHCDATTSKCTAQVGPGGSCESATTAGTADATLCKNAVCETFWTTSSATIVMCTDAAVPAFNGGTGLVCDGK
jgi:hypothetical protein